MTEPITGPCAYGARLPVTKAMAEDVPLLMAMINHQVPAMARDQMAENVRDRLDVIIDGYKLYDPETEPVQFEPKPENLLWVIVRARIVEQEQSDETR